MKQTFRALFAPLAFAATTALAAVPAAAEVVPLATLSQYLNGLGTVQAQFTQTNDDGSTSSGNVTIKRPGRIKLDYPADKTMVMGSGGQVAIFDGKSNEAPTRFPMATTPLNLILARDIDLTTSRMVTAHQEVNGDTMVRAQDPDHPEYGSIDLYFGGNPLVLKAWVVNDDAGGATTVQLTQMSLGGSVSDRLFNIRAEMSARGF
ncbi:lipoprotein chaperone [Aquimixticola soesokkakensis]|uniref:Lipoprotein chaperone n=1 Tax=Aquimixticola soesokkakensis TaxID=1519096 RepID=A0A1Y5TP03_9RHOB|nr:outer membrane lipoprotein carrier protein LolA [Aquimixticola soesokkakensis]SLN68517.1 lipoprotein chaperone [Aquimixticola soesokkakensis]